MPKVNGVIPSAAAEPPHWMSATIVGKTTDGSVTPAKRTRLEYSTVAKTGLIEPAAKNDYYFNFPAKNNQNNQKNQKKIEKFQQNNKNNVKKIINPAFNSQEFTEVSIMHLLDNSTPKALKKACYGDSNTKIGCSWNQFSGNINAAIDYVAFKIDDEYVSYQHDSPAKATYFMFYNEESAEKCMNTTIYYNGIAVELYQTVTLEEEAQIITIPNTNSCIKSKSNGKFHTYGMKFLFKKTIDSFEIPAFLELDKFVLALTYRGCKPVCSFCKQQGCWKSECTEIQKFRQNNAKYQKKFGKNAQKISQNIFGLAPKTNNNADLDALCNDTIATITDTFAQLENPDQKIEFIPKILSTKTLMSIKKRRELFRLTKNNADVIPLYNELKVNTAKAIKNDVKLKYLKELEAVTDDLIKNNTRVQANGPVINKDQILISDPDQKMQKWISLINSKDQIFSECFTEITWNEVIAALKDIPNNKAPGTDKLPS
ncbi:hypothetical protein BB561_006464 [Smittium simulii]|uniref:Uncharacterized protein n=1 Tax=Smittium simulii TaxID=133385 RepID=A0A2T9Y4A6_9FUNG|nr:hypothetical protein BB561_006464 [Smittium simulii]